MKLIGKFLHSLSGKIIIAVCIIIAAFVLNRLMTEKKQEEKAQSTDRIQYAESVDEDNKILKLFKENFPDTEVILACEEDLTDDGLMDLVVIYKTGKHIRMVVGIDEGEGTSYRFTEPLPGPVENQKLQFKNIDEEGPMEFIISGEKNGNVGYAIYRIIDGEPADLFGDGMEECC